ncbi:uncharacterized protein K460DRAFT_5934 [Cucurbitaria berberidis CBS 394.84]|uniref:Uncharacterized protein n=1 Tax=Cucurbitaria berberidis CBS 394.84 TaxID=1168544 RepID=A0A9P4LCP0_9PLEO|nr:uncharacterized protein K460DRAFT_5934 [Cucurbitaria berberidis CBS 394.84]KAF1849893.1 hypothetical protein K460DRAFT_5934 [Cucurbitaria berberidis CBS 394.84]
MGLVGCYEYPLVTIAIWHRQILLILTSACRLGGRSTDEVMLSTCTHVVHAESWRASSLIRTDVVPRGVFWPLDPYATSVHVSVTSDGNIEQVFYFIHCISSRHVQGPGCRSATDETMHSSSPATTPAEDSTCAQLQGRLPWCAGRRTLQLPV